MRRLISISFSAFSVLFLACKPSPKNKVGTAKNDAMKSMPSVTVHPAPNGLESVHGLTESSFFDIAVNGEDAFVYHSREIKDEHEHRKQLNSISYQGVSYVNFSIFQKVELEIEALKDAVDWEVMPKIEGVDITEANTLKITLHEPKKFVVTATIQGTEHNFIVSAEPPETNIPTKDEVGVLYLGPGVHKYGQAWDPYIDGIHTVYIAGGAVVEATINSKNKKNIKLLGRGILSQSFVTHAEESTKDTEEQEWDADWLGVVFTDSQNIEIDGIAIMSSPSYQLEVANCKDVTIKNVKLCGFGEHNNDGLHTYSTDVLVEDSFIASNDDRICITGLYDKDDGRDGVTWDGSNTLTGVPASNITIRNMVFWGLDNNGGDIMLTWNGANYAKNILVENSISLTPTNKAFIAARHGGSADINDLTIKNVTLNHGNLFDIVIGGKNYQGAGGGKLRNMHLENIVIDATNAEIGKQLIGENEESSIDGVTLKNITTKDGKLTSVEQLNITQNKFVNNLAVVTE